MFVLGNLLFRQDRSPFEWIDGILLTGDAYRSLYFSGLAGGVLFTGALLLFATRAGSVAIAFSKALTGLLAFLVVVQFLLLPVNYGILIVSQQLPRVAEFPGSEKPASGEQIWLVWEAKQAMMCFSRSTDDKRSLITLPRKDPNTIVGYDNIFRLRREARRSFLRSLVQRRSPHARAPLGLGPRLRRNECTSTSRRNQGWLGHYPGRTFF